MKFYFLGENIPELQEVPAENRRGILFYAVKESYKDWRLLSLISLASIFAIYILDIVSNDIPFVVFLVVSVWMMFCYNVQKLFIRRIIAKKIGGA